MDGESRATPAKTTPLGAWWIVAVAVIGVMAAALAVGGMILSFRAVSAEMAGTFGHWAWLVPIVIDLAVFVFSGVDLLLNRLRMAHPLARIMVYGATLGTVWLNYSAGGSSAGRAAHILMPSVWVGFVELMRHVVRRLTGLADGTLREPVPVARWLLSPWRTAKLWRRMVLWQTNSYPKALAQEKRRLEAIALLQEEHGPFWRWRVGPLVRLRLSLGEAPTTPAPANAVAENLDKAFGANPAEGANGSDKPKAANGKPTVKAPETKASAPKPSAANPAAKESGELGGGQLGTETWIEITKPHYAALRADTGKRPTAEELASKMTTEVEKRIAAGEFTSAVTGPSLSTAKRIRGLIEGRFPHLTFGAAAPESAQEATTGQRDATEEVA